MKKVALGVFMIAIAIVGIPLSFMISMQVPFNVALNAFFNSSLETMAFYFLQFLLVIILTELILHSQKTQDTIYLQWANVMMLVAFVISKWYIYYLLLALIAWISMSIIHRLKNKQTDEITEIIHGVKEEYTDK